MRKSLQNITPLLSTEQAFKHSDVFLHPLHPTTAPAFTLLEGTRRFCFKTHVVQSNVFYTKHVVWTSLSAKRSLSTRFWKPTPQPARLLPITSFSPKPPCSAFPRALTEKSPGLMTQCVTRYIEGKDIRCIPSGARLSLGSWVGNLAGPPWERRSMKRDGGIGGRARHPLCRCAAAIKQVDRKQERNIRNSEDYDFFLSSPQKQKK